jgi:hypothetical protein
VQSILTLTKSLQNTAFYTFSATYVVHSHPDKAFDERFYPISGFGNQGYPIGKVFAFGRCTSIDF